MNIVPIHKAAGGGKRTVCGSRKFVLKRTTKWDRVTCAACLTERPVQVVKLPDQVAVERFAEKVANEPVPPSPSDDLLVLPGIANDAEAHRAFRAIKALGGVPRVISAVASSVNVALVFESDAPVKPVAPAVAPSHEPPARIVVACGSQLAMQLERAFLSGDSIVLALHGQDDGGCWRVNGQERIHTRAGEAVAYDLLHWSRA